LQTRQQFAAGTALEDIALEHGSTNGAPYVFEWVEKSLEHCKNSVRLSAALDKLGYTKCFTDNALQRHAAQTMGHPQAVPGEKPEHASDHEEVLYPIADDDDEHQQQFYTRIAMCCHGVD
jgi:hypothetical protein